MPVIGRNGTVRSSRVRSNVKIFYHIMEILKITKDKPDVKKLQNVSDVLKNGGVIAFPTDTVYGLAANAFNLEAQKKIYKLKGRNFRKPLIIMVSDVRYIKFFADIPHKASNLIKKFWPGALTIILNTTDYGKIIMGGRSNIGVRIPDDKICMSILESCGFPIATTSANPSSEKSAVTAKEVKGYFKSGVDLILDAGRCRNAKESTVLDMTHFPYTVVREGCLPSKKLLDYI